MKKGWKRFWITSGAIAGIGVLFLILGFILGVSFSKIKFGFPYIFPLSNRVVTVKESTGQTGEEKTFEGVKNLEMDVDHMSVYLKPSQNGKVCVGTEDIDERANLQIYKEGDTLNIETDLESNRINQAGTIILYLPQDVKFYEMDISVGAGSLKSKAAKRTCGKCGYCGSGRSRRDTGHYGARDVSGMWSGFCNAYSPWSTRRL